MHILVFYLIFTSFYDKLTVKIDIELWEQITFCIIRQFRFLEIVFLLEIVARCNIHKIETL
jgi:hypothetical protein